MKKVWSLILTAFLLSLSFSLAYAEGDQDFKIINKTGIDIFSLKVTQHHSTEWGENILGRDSLANEEQMEVIFHRDEKECMWDIQVLDKSGLGYQWENIDLCSTSKIVLHFDGKSAWATYE